MVEKISRETRSRIMRSIKGKNTGPEMLVRSALHRAGFRFRLHQRDLPGRPDIVLPRYKAAIFVNGCFWHRHRGCRKTTTPDNNFLFWQEKFAKTKARDEQNQNDLRNLGWNVLVIWECELLDSFDETMNRVFAWLGERTIEKRHVKSQ